MKIVTLAVVFLITCICVPGFPRGVDDTTSEIPFTFEKGYVIVQATIQSQAPVEMVLGTGLEHSTFDGGMIGKYKLSLGYTFDDPKRCSLTDCTYTFSNIPNLTLGKLKPVSLFMRLGTLEKVEKRIGRPVFGMLGADFFKGRVVQFDFAKKVVRFLPARTDDTPRDTRTLPATDRIVFRMGFYDESTILPIAEEVTFDGKKIRTIIDTGAATVFTLSPAATKQLGLPLPPDKGAPRAGKVGSLRLGDYELTDVPVQLYGKGVGFDRDVKEYGAIAGTGLLQNFVTTFDFRGKVIILEHI